MNHPRRGIVWDLDHTLYESNDRILHAWLRMLAEPVVAHGYADNADSAFQLLNASFLRYGHALTELSQKHGFNERDFIAQAFPKTDQTLYTIQYIEKCDKTFAALEQHQHIPQVILTSALRIWADAVVAHLTFDLHFPPDRIIALEESDYQSKSLSRLPFDLASKALGLPLETLVMVEDNINNLAMAKSLGLTTILITHGQPHDGAEHVDFVVNKAYDVFELIKTGEISWAKEN
jgi:FMN phosphatase YigB (HAD superfamily)